MKNSISHAIIRSNFLLFVVSFTSVASMVLGAPTSGAADDDDDGVVAAAAVEVAEGVRSEL